MTSEFAPTSILKNSKTSSTGPGSVSMHERRYGRFSAIYGQLERVQNAGDVAKRLQSENEQTIKQVREIRQQLKRCLELDGKDPSVIVTSKQSNSPSSAERKVQYAADHQAMRHQFTFSRPLLRNKKQERAARDGERDCSGEPILSNKDEKPADCKREPRTNTSSSLKDQNLLLSDPHVKN